MNAWENEFALNDRQDKKKLQDYEALIVSKTKGQLISKWFLGMVDFLQKTNKNKSFSSKVEFIRSFFGGNR